MQGAGLEMQTCEHGSIDGFLVGGFHLEKGKEELDIAKGNNRELRGCKVEEEEKYCEGASPGDHFGHECGNMQDARLL